MRKTKKVIITVNRAGSNEPEFGLRDLAFIDGRPYLVVRTVDERDQPMPAALTPLDPALLRALQPGQQADYVYISAPANPPRRL